MRAQRRLRAPRVRRQRRVEIAARLRQNQAAHQIRTLLGEAERDVSAARMAEKVDCATQPLKKCDEVGDMLGDGEVIADPVPMLREKSPQARRDDAMMARQRAKHASP